MYMHFDFKSPVCFSIVVNILTIVIIIVSQSIHVHVPLVNIDQYQPDVAGL